MNAAIAVLIVLLASTLGDPDPAAIRQLPNDDSGVVHCGGDQVIWNNQRSFTAGATGSATLRATSANGAVLLDIQNILQPGEKLIPLWCGDLLGDGSQIFAFEMFSGGAHCCFSESLVQLKPGARHLLDIDLGNGGLGPPQQLGEGGPLELVGSSDVFAYFGDLSFAASPFMPLIFAYDGQQYVEATRQFPDFLNAEVDSADAALAEAVARPVQSNVPRQFAYQEQESIALRLYALHALLGDADAALPQIEAHLSRPAADWLASHAAAAADAIANAFG